MARIIDENEDGEDFDLSDLACPRCGCDGPEILQYPRGDAPRLHNGRWSGAWFGSTGRARCRHCGAVFSIQMEQADAEQAQP